MANWTQNHDLVYAFVCVSFLADGEVDESEKEAMRGNCKVMAPDMSEDDYNTVEAEVIDKFPRANFSLSTSIMSMETWSPNTQSPYMSINALK